MEGKTSGCGKRMKPIILALLVGGGALAGFAASTLAQWPSGGSTLSLTQAGAIVEKLTHDEARVSKVFPGPAGLTGIIIDGKSSGPLVAWITNTRSAVIVGGVVDAKTNKNMTVLSTMRYLVKKHDDAGNVAAPVLSNKPAADMQPATAPSKLVPVSDAATSSASDGETLLKKFIDGASDGSFAQVAQPGLSGPHTIYAFVDPNCIFCHKLFDYVQGHMAQFQQAGVRVVYVPVAILKQSSIAKAAEVAEDGWPALSRNEKNFNVDTEEGGLKGLSGAALSHYAAVVRVNTNWMNHLAAANQANSGTPFLVWMAGNGRAYYLDGLPNGKGFNALFASVQPGWTPGK